MRTDYLIIREYACVTGTSYAKVMGMRITHKHDWQLVSFKTGKMVVVEKCKCNECDARLIRRTEYSKYHQFVIGKGLMLRTHNGQNLTIHSLMITKVARFITRKQITWSDTLMSEIRCQYLDANSNISRIRLI